MEYVEGRTLRELLADGPLPIKKLLDVATQISEGLAKAHAALIVHRDLKPENVMVSRDGYVKILDFGLAKLRPASSGVEPEMTTLERFETQEGVVLGTVAYMSPEQAKGQPVDFRSDQFSLGGILYEMATAKRPFERPSSAETLAAILQREPEPVALRNPSVPLHLGRIVERCLSKDPQDRYDSTRDLARDLREAASSVLPAPTAGAARKRWPAAAGLAGLVVLLAVTLYAWKVWVGGAGGAPQIRKGRHLFPGSAYKRPGLRCRLFRPGGLLQPNGHGFHRETAGGHPPEGNRGGNQGS
jgi:serine/threonine protein kinase